MQFNELCEGLDIRPILMIGIIRYHIRGYNKLEISKYTGINRNTVAKYIDKLKRLDTKVLHELYAGYWNEVMK